MRSTLSNTSLTLLKTLLKAPIESVIDVGVQHATPFLIDVFPRAFHYLFEPVTLYHDSIRKNYESAGVRYQLIGSAASNTGGMLYQHLQSLDGLGKVTHSQLLPCRDETLSGLIAVVETPVVKLDAYFSEVAINNYLVKLDVDGIEELIIEGGRRVIKNASVVVVEAPLGKMASRIKLLEHLGMRLFDITDMYYYYDQLQQVDLVFVNTNITQGDIDFSPFKKYQPIDWSQWCKATG